MEPSLQPLHELAHRFGISTVYRDGLGQECRPGPDSLVTILNALGCPLDSRSGAAEALEHLDAGTGRGTLPRSIVLFGSDRSRLDAYLPAGAEAHVELEQGGTTDPADLPYGRHTLVVKERTGTARCLLLAAPETAYPPDRLFPDRAWGLFLPLYAAHTGPDTGVGSLADLERLMDWTGSLGGSLVGTLPMNAAFLDRPFFPSPYTPASRLFWNELYLDPERLPPSGNGDRIDYRTTMAARRRVLETAAASSREYLDLAAADRYLLPYARFRAETERRGAGWRSWPEPARSGELTVTDDDPAVSYHLYAQWAFQQRLKSIVDDGGPGRALYLDMPLGLHPDSFDTWAHPALFATGVTVGVPPDTMFPGGQNWNFPPLHQEANRNDRYRYISETIRRQTRFASLLRIDHVLGMHRQFWIPEGADPSEGTYVAYPADELYAVLIMESHRNRCAVAGEDLGVVPDGVRETMAARGLLRMYVSQVQPPPSPPPVDVVAGLNTHDLRPFAGFLDGLDIDDRLDHGFMEPSDEATARQQRRELIRQVTATLRDAGLLPSAEPGPEQLLEAWLLWIGAGPARFVVVNAEDLCLETRAQNVPGTGDDRPNWVGKAALSLADMEQSDRITAVLRRLAAARQPPKGNR